VILLEHFYNNGSFETGTKMKNSDIIIAMQPIINKFNSSLLHEISGVFTSRRRTYSNNYYLIALRRIEVRAHHYVAVE